MTTDTPLKEILQIVKLPMTLSRAEYMPVGFMEWLGDITFATAWETCNNGAWLLHLAQILGARIETITLVKVKCARLAKHLMTDRGSIHALIVAERFATIGNISWDEINGAIRDAESAVEAAINYAKAYWDSDAGIQAEAAFDPETYVYAAKAAFGAISPGEGNSVIFAVADAIGGADDTVRDNILKQCAVICREVISLDQLGEIS